LTRFEQELNASPDLLVDLDLYKEVDEAIADTEVLDFRAQLTDLREETRKSETGKKGFSLYPAMALCSFGSIGTVSSNWLWLRFLDDLCPTMISLPST
jgi:hypothetical protein